MTMLAAATSTSTAMPVDAIAAAKMFSDADVAEVRHVVQRILVPCVFVIGLLGNSVSIYVLTRKRMRCTTNIYLTALAITDIAYLTFVLILSLKHYEYIKYHCELYWRLYGFVVWLCDACAYISIYIAVCFTIERFIAIRYPLKRQTFCTESLAKKVIAAVALFCLLTTLSTAFEHTYDINWKLIDGAYRPCNLTLANVSPTPMAMPTPAQSMTTAWHIEEPAGNPATSRYLEPFDLSSDSGSGSGAGEPDHIPSRQRRLPAFTSASVGVTAAATEPTTASATASLLQLSRARRSEDNYNYNNDANNNHDSSNNNINNNSAFAFNITEYCQNMTFYSNGLSSLGQNPLYFNIWSVYTLIVFVLLPLFVLATFNCFLILLVHRSKSLRGDLTNASSIRRTKRKSNSGLTGSVSQENRVTITLIAVVLLFIVCQLPWAIYLILVQYVDIEMNIQRVAGNVCNLLVAINAAANFFLYCVLSDKYRKTVRELVTGYRYRHRHARNNISLYVPHTSTTLNGDGASSVASGGGYSAYSGASSRRCRGKAAVARRLIA
ncbi:hypothetical protein AWZ03_012096 [Drosophila navojoa]|uniref:G-protein coupled receptors family 1 profile domain-containing protein n=1 Tax=Drosophila navojoa TaxID=7232 RepID=A0A484AY00_DRONA|nr:uncharacterized protein LOC108658682 [Drosophila navojoa]TDG41479.1 hypothetical protein AWZ03_012096 [Drosophila navojoa]